MTRRHDTDARGRPAAAVGAYPALPPNISAHSSTKLDSAGAMFQMGSTNTAPPSCDVITRRTIEGASTVVYTEATNPRVKIHISALFTGP